MEPIPLSNRWNAWLVAAGLGVLAWRALTVWFPHPAGTDPDLVRLVAAVMGLWFMAWGLWAFRETRTVPALVFACYGLSAGAHWGGPLGVGPEPMQNFLLAAWVVVSSVLNQSLFLHLAAVFPPAPGRPPRALRVAIYLPVMLAVLLLGALALNPANRQLLQAFFIFFPLGVLYSMVGGGVFIWRLFTAEPETRRIHRLTMVVTALVVGWLPHAATSTFFDLGPESEGWFNLPFAILPPALAWALARPHRSRPGLG